MPTVPLLSTPAIADNSVALATTAYVQAQGYLAAVPNLDASKITTGTLATARLGSGTASTTTFLRGDSTWAVPAGGGGGMAIGGAVASGTANSVLYVDAAGNLGQTAATLGSDGQMNLPGLVVGGTELGGYVPASHKAQINSSGTATPLMLSGGSGTVEIWKDTTPTRAAAFGMAAPGLAIGNDFVFSLFDGTGWMEVARFTAAGVITGNGSGLTNIAEGQVTNLTTDLAAKAPLASPAFTGTVRMDSHYGAITADADGATITFSMAASDWHSVTLGGNRTLAVANVQVGQQFVIRLGQDATGSRTVTWFSGITWMTTGGATPALATAAGKVNVFTFKCTATGAYDGFAVGSNA